MLAAVKRLPKSTFVRNVLSVLTGTAIAQGLTFLFAPVLSRLYTPEEFGTFALFTSVIGVLGVIAGFRYYLALVLPKSDDQAIGLFKVSLLSTAAVAACLALVMVTIDAATSSRLELGFVWIFVLPLSVLISGVHNTVGAWLTRLSRFRSLSAARVTFSGTSALSQVLLGVLSFTGSGLVFGYVAGQTLASLMMMAQSGRALFSKLQKAWNRPELYALAKEYREFPLYNTSQGLLNSLSVGVPTFLLSYFFGAEVTGFYGQAIRFVLLPVSLFGESVRQVFFSSAAARYSNNEPVNGFLLKTTLSLAALGLIPTVIIVLWGPDIFSIVLGSSWRTSGEYARWLMLWSGMGLLVNVPSSMMLQVLRKQRLLFQFDVLLLVARVLALVIPGIFGSAKLAIISYSVVGLVFNIGFILYVHKLCFDSTERASTTELRRVG